ncbi:uncharacterized protein [Miscanthus floridulus]|uniref:uncharacterized protein n=1 Tax=Miscanthus floridulus TaxID=154761 RepID=UPI00345795BE
MHAASPSTTGAPSAASAGREHRSATPRAVPVESAVALLQLVPPLGRRLRASLRVAALATVARRLRASLRDLAPIRPIRRLQPASVRPTPDVPAHPAAATRAEESCAAAAAPGSTRLRISTRAAAPAAAAPPALRPSARPHCLAPPCAGHLPDSHRRRRLPGVGRGEEEESARRIRGCASPSTTGAPSAAGAARPSPA